MNQLHDVYKCEVCGNIVEFVNPGKAPLMCCGQKMKHMAEGTSDGAKEKHVPVLEKTANGYKVTVGSAPHAMTEEHFIEWIELIADGVSYKKFLKPGDEPVAEFVLEAENVYVREYCNLHGLYKSL